MDRRLVKRSVRAIVATVVTTMFPGIVVVSAIAMSQACSSGGSDPGPDSISVGGTYSTVVSLTENSCGPSVTVQSNPTIVTHASGATALSLQHGSLTYNGAVTSAGAFTTQSTVFVDGQTGAKSTLSVAGQFSLSGFVADVAVAVEQSAAPVTCAYKVHWIGTKQGSPNKIP